MFLMSEYLELQYKSVVEFIWYWVKTPERQDVCWLFVKTNIPHVSDCEHFT